jgi:hypothetical protein
MGWSVPRVGSMTELVHLPRARVESVVALDTKRARYVYRRATDKQTVLGRGRGR